MYKYWTKEEDEFLIKNYPKYGIKYCIKHLNKTESQIVSRAQKFQIKVEFSSIRPSKDSQIAILIPWEQFDKLPYKTMIPFECVGCCQVHYREKRDIYMNIKNNQKYIFCSRDCNNIINKARAYAGLMPHYGNFYKSKPCEQLKTWLKEKGVPFQEEVQVLKHLGYNYYVDILFEEFGTIIEINGKQHYNQKGNLIPYYRKRHKLLAENGWRVIEIPSNEIYTKGFLDNLLKIIYDKNAPLNYNLEYKNFIPKIYYCKCGKKMDRESKLCRKCWFKKKKRDCPIGKEEFHYLMWNYGYHEIINKFNVSFYTVRRWAKEFNFSSYPNRTYWNSMNNKGIIDYQI